MTVDALVADFQAEQLGENMLALDAGFMVT